MSTNRLTSVKIRSFIKKGDRGKKLSDGDGMFLTLTPAGTATWRMKYRLGGRELLYSIGTYDAVTLETARAARAAVKAMIAEGRDPVQARRLERADRIASAADSFRALGDVWLGMRKAEWSPIHYAKSSRAFERDVYPKIGNLPVADIKPGMVAGIVEAILRRGSRDTAVRVLQHLEGVFRLAQARQMRDDNPATPTHEEVPRKRGSGRMPALLTFVALGKLLRGAAAAHLSPAVYMAHRLIAFTAARIGNVVAAQWSEFDLQADVATWTLAREQMKAKDREHDHTIILCSAIADELRQWRKQSRGRYVFPSPTGGHSTITREALEKVYRVTLKLAKKHSPHGWRSSFVTLAREEGKFERDVVELALDHLHDTAVVRAYDRGDRLQQRVKLMTWWGEQLSQAQAGADVVRLRRHGKAA